MTAVIDCKRILWEWEVSGEEMGVVSHSSNYFQNRNEKGLHIIKHPNNNQFCFRSIEPFDNA